MNLFASSSFMKGAAKTPEQIKKKQANKKSKKQNKKTWKVTTQIIRITGNQDLISNNEVTKNFIKNIFKICFAHILRVIMFEINVNAGKIHVYWI